MSPNAPGRVSKRSKPSFSSTRTEAVLTASTLATIPSGNAWRQIASAMQTRAISVARPRPVKGSRSAYSSSGVAWTSGSTR